MAYIAALHVHAPQRGLFGRCEAKTGIEPFGDDQLLHAA
jgi:hypothetical protein